MLKKYGKQQSARTKSPADLSQHCFTGFRDSAQQYPSKETSLVEFPAMDIHPTSLPLSTQLNSTAKLTAICFFAGLFFSSLAPRQLKGESSTRANWECVVGMEQRSFQIHQT